MAKNDLKLLSYQTIVTTQQIDNLSRGHPNYGWEWGCGLEIILGGVFVLTSELAGWRIGVELLPLSNIAGGRYGSERQNRNSLC